MKAGCILLIAVQVGCANQSAPADRQRGGVTVDRVWSEESTSTARALVTYTNTTSRTFAQNVTIQCVARVAGRAVGQGSRSFFAFERGAIQPGFTGTLEIPARLNGADFDMVDCEVIEAN